MRAASLAAALPLVCLLAAPASVSDAAAETAIAADAPRPPRRLELRLGTLLGSGDVGDARGFSGGLHVGAGVRRARA